jgi:beta-glucanase (GH16 family)
MKKNTIALLVAIVAIGIISCSDNRRRGETYREGWTLVWQDNFNGPSIDESIWSKVPQGEDFSNRFMSSDNSLFIFHEGSLVLRGTNNPEENAEQPFVTAGITTAGNKRLANVSRIEARIRTTPVQGAIYYFSLLPTDGTENISIKVMSRYGTDGFVYHDISSEYTQTMRNEPSSVSLIRLNPANFQTFAIEKHPDSLVFFVNDQRTKMYPRIETELEGQFPFNDMDFSLFFSVNLRDNTNPEDLPAYMFIDWVRYYERDMATAQ